MTTVTPPRNGIPIGIASIGGQRVLVEVHPEYLRWFEGLTGRVGGVTGSSTNDLTVSQFEDAGIEEHKHALFRLADDSGQHMPHAEALPYEDMTPPVVYMHPADDVGPGVEELRAQVAELTKAVQALQQGLTA